MFYTSSGTGTLLSLITICFVFLSWNRNPMRVLGSSAAWRYIATNSGAMRQYPGRQTYNNRSAENCHYRHVMSFGQKGWEGKAHLNSVYPYLNSQKFPFHSSLAQAKLAVSTASVISLSQCLNRQLFRRSCVTIMLLR